MLRLYRLLIRVQALYTLVTALWGLVHIESFMRVTGPKTDVWLVKTVCLLLIPMALCLFSQLSVRAHPLPAAVLGGLSAAGLAFIDIYYTANGTIKWVYLLDALPQVVFLLLWLFLLYRLPQVRQQLGTPP